MIDFDIDPEELKRLAAEVERELKLTRPRPPSLPPNCEPPDTPKTPTQPKLEAAMRTEDLGAASRAEPASAEAPYMRNLANCSRRWAEFVTPTSNRRQVHFGSYLLTLLGIVMPLLVAYMAFGLETPARASERLQQQGTAGYWLKLAVVGASFVLAIKLYTYSLRLRAPSALAVMRKDQRPPILLLRAFQDDYAAVENAAPFGSWRSVAAKVGLSRNLTLEELLYDLFSRCGPVIAIGRPGETVPPLGASRFWVSNSRWQEAVEDLLEESRRVVMIMGPIEERAGLTWEAKKLLGLPNPNKAVFVIPPLKEEQARHRWDRYSEVCGNRFPTSQGGELVAGFDPQGNCQVIRIGQPGSEPQRDESAYRAAIRVPPRPRLGTIAAICVLLLLWSMNVIPIFLPAIQLVREQANRSWLKKYMIDYITKAHRPALPLPIPLHPWEFTKQPQADKPGASTPNESSEQLDESEHLQWTELWVLYAAMLATGVCVIGFIFFLCRRRPTGNQSHLDLTTSSPLGS